MCNQAFRIVCNDSFRLCALLCKTTFIKVFLCGATLAHFNHQAVAVIDNVLSKFLDVTFHNFNSFLYSGLFSFIDYIIAYTKLNVNSYFQILLILFLLGQNIEVKEKRAFQPSLKTFLFNIAFTCAGVNTPCRA